MTRNEILAEIEGAISWLETPRESGKALVILDGICNDMQSKDSIERDHLEEIACKGVKDDDLSRYRLAVLIEENKRLKAMIEMSRSGLNDMMNRCADVAEAIQKEVKGH